MQMIKIVMQNEEKAQRLPGIISRQLKVRQGRLVTRVARMSRDATKKKIVAGAYAGPSKWIKAKKGSRKALRGMARSVYFRKVSKNSAIVDSRDPRYNLAQHHYGYTKQAGTGGRADRVFGDWVIMPLRQPTALRGVRGGGQGGFSNIFMFKWTKNKRPSVVPARDIIPEESFLVNRAEGIGKVWAVEVINESLKKVGLQGLVGGLGTTLRFK